MIMKSKLPDDVFSKLPSDVQKYVLELETNNLVLSKQNDLLKEDLTKLANGQDIMAPEYLINGTGISVPKSIPIQSKKFILVEGMAAMYKDVKDLFDVKIYIDIDPKIQKKRVINRRFCAINSQKQPFQAAFGCLRLFVRILPRYTCCAFRKCRLY